MAAGTDSDERLLELIVEYHLWLNWLDGTSQVALGFSFSVEELLALEGNALDTRLAEAKGFMSGAFASAMQRAEQACTSERSLARAEDLLRWFEIAGRYGVRSTAGLQGPARAEGDVPDISCVEIHYDRVEYPTGPSIDTPEPLDLRVGYRFGESAARFDQAISFRVNATGATPTSATAASTATGNGMPPAGALRFAYAGDGDLTLTVQACLVTEPELPLLSGRVCQTALVVRGELTVTPPDVTLEAGATQLFGAERFGAPTGDVTWDATGGTITSGGLFTAGDFAGNYTVTATSNDPPIRTAQAEVSVTAEPKIHLQELFATVYAGGEIRDRWLSVADLPVSGSPGGCGAAMLEGRADEGEDGALTIVISADLLNDNPACGQAIFRLQFGISGADFDYSFEGAASGSGEVALARGRIDGPTYGSEVLGCVYEHTWSSCPVGSPGASTSGVMTLRSAPSTHPANTYFVHGRAGGPTGTFSATIVLTPRPPS